MFQLLPQDIHIDFVSKKSIFRWISLGLLTLSFLVTVLITPHYGIDFRGGTDIVLDFKGTPSIEEVRSAATVAGFPDANVQTYGTGDHQQFLVQTLQVSVVNADSVQVIQQNLAALPALKRADWDPSHPDRMELSFDQEPDQDAILNAVKAAGIEGTTLKAESPGEQLYPFTLKFEELSQKVRDGFSKAMPDTFNAETGLVRLETVGPRAGEQLRYSAIISVFATLIMLLVYISFRFDFRYAPGAIIALVHDVLICWAFLTLTEIEISLTTVAALLTVIGYSLNDTIIIYDRIRENLYASGDGNIIHLVNKSTNETLSRTIITSATTLIALISLTIFTTGNIQDFALTLLIGVIAGTLSTLFIATPVMVFMDQYIRTRRKSQALLATEPATE